MNVMTGAVAAACAFCGARMIWSARSGMPKEGLPRVLTFHKIASFETGGTWIAPGRFERYIDDLLDAGWRFVGEGEFIDSIRGDRTGADREVLLTFDDGYESFARLAAPVLRARSLPALVFLVTGSAGSWNDWEIPLPGRRARHMDWETVRSLRAEGFDFGSHTESHRALTRLGEEEAALELAVSKSRIEDETGRRVRSVSYPFGKVDPAAARLASRAGYEAGFTLYPPGRVPADCREYMIRREGVWVIDSSWTISKKLSRGGLFWLEDLKGRSINSLAGLVPMRRKAAGRDHDSGNSMV